MRSEYVSTNDHRVMISKNVTKDNDVFRIEFLGGAKDTRTTREHFRRQSALITTDDSHINMVEKALISAASRFIAGRNAVQTVYWRSTTNGNQSKLLKVSKTCAFGKPNNEFSMPTHIKQDHKLRC
ncbi:uncharacterized protein CBL_07512 [Carabus blaptoides fortunei]